MIASQKQINFITSLIIQKVVEPPDVKERLVLRITGSDNPLSTFEASKTIEWLLAKPDKAGAAPQSSDLEAKVPEGRYAIQLEQPDAAGNKVHFYTVDKPGEDSKWHGRTFVGQEIGGRERAEPIRNPVERAEVLRRIAVDPAAALLLYGQLIGRCGHCGRTLTNDESRARGIGPVCLKKDGMKWGL